MPKTRIKEIDNTGVLQLGVISNTVYIPGGCAVKAIEPTLCSTVAELNALKDANDAIFDKTLSYKMAKDLIQRGMKVLYQGFVVASADTSITITEDDWKRLEDRNLYDIRFLTTGGYAIPSAAMVQCAANRGDCVALIDHAKAVSYKVDEIREAFETAVEGVEPQCSFAAAFTPWYSCHLGEVPASFGYLSAYAESIKTNPSWFAVAGSFRGIIPGLNGVLHEYTTAEVEILQARGANEEVDMDDDLDNRGIAINAISYVRPTGYIINGNRTMLENAGTLKATSFLNIRNLVSEINKTMYEAANRYRFEQNDFTVWTKFTSLVIPLLERAKSDSGLYDYRLIRLGTDAKGRVKGRLVISAIEAVEDFDLEIILSDQVDTIEA